MTTTPSPTTTSEATSDAPARQTTTPSSDALGATEDGREALETRDPEAALRSEEAKGYRLRLRDAEAERNALRDRLDGYERREVEAIARSLGATQPADVWALVELNDLRADDVLDVELARERITDLLRDRPTWRRQVDLGSGPRPSVSSKPELGLATLLGKRR